MKTTAIVTIAGASLIAATAYAADVVADIPLWKLWLLKRQLLKDELPPVESEERPLIRQGGDSHLHHQQGWLGEAPE